VNSLTEAGIALASGPPEMLTAKPATLELASATLQGGEPIKVGTKIDWIQRWANHVSKAAGLYGEHDEPSKEYMPTGTTVPQTPVELAAEILFQYRKDIVAVFGDTFEQALQVEQGTKLGLFLATPDVPRVAEDIARALKAWNDGFHQFQTVDTPKGTAQVLPMEQAGEFWSALYDVSRTMSARGATVSTTEKLKAFASGAVDGAKNVLKTGVATAKLAVETGADILSGLVSALLGPFGVALLTGVGVYVGLSWLGVL